MFGKCEITEWAMIIVALMYTKDSGAKMNKKLFRNTISQIGILSYITLS